MNSVQDYLMQFTGGFGGRVRAMFHAVLDAGIIRFRSTTLSNLFNIDLVNGRLSAFGATPVARPPAYTQTYSTADRTHANLTATSIAAAVPAAAPTGGTGAAAGGWDTAANRDSAITTINDLRTHAIEIDLDYEALLVDLTDLKQLVNSVIDDLQSEGWLQ